MADRIKGITIEIGGDATPLQKSLEGVNKSSKSLKTELKDVERLLKLDPTNTTLLAQKQELLGKSVQNTKEKLDQLRQAEAQVQEQAAKGEITEEQYRAFQREIESTTEELGYLERELGKTADAEKNAGSALTELKNTISDQEKELAKLKEEYQNTVLEQGKHSEAAKELKGRIEELDKELSNNKEKLEKSAYQTQDASEKWKKFGETMKQVAEVAAKVVVALGKAAISAGKAIVEMTASAAYNADELNTLAKQTGLSTETLQKFQYASEQIDVSMDTLTGSLSKLTKNMASAKDGTGSAAEAFKTLGVSVTDANGNLRDNEEVFADVIDALGKVENETERDALAMQLFGKSAQDLNPLILGGADALKQLGDEAEEAGLILSQDMLDSLNTLSDAIDTAKATLTALGNLFATVFAEDIAGFVNDFTDGAKRLGKAFREGGVDGLAEEFGTVLGEMVNKIAEALPKIVKGGLQIVKKFAQSILQNMGEITKAAVEIVTELIRGLLESLPMIATAAGEMIGALGQSLGEGLPTLIPLIVEGIAQFIQAIVDQIPTILEAGLQIVQGLVEGILNAIPVLIEAVPNIITGLIEALLNFIPQIIETGITLLTSLTEHLPQIISTICEAIPQIITGIVDALISSIPQIIDAGINLFIALIENLPQIISTIIQAIPQIITAIVNALVQSWPKIEEAGKQLFEKLIERGPEVLNEIGNFVSNLINSIVTAITNAFQQFVDVGYNIVTGIWNGISNGWNWLVNQVTSLAQNLLNAAKSALGIASPSKKFRDEVGKMMAKGIGVGFDIELPKQISSAKSRLLEGEKKLAAAATNNNQKISHNTTLGGITVYITGGVANVAEARQLGGELAQELQRELRYKGVLQLA